MIDEGASLRDVAIAHFAAFVKHSNGFMKYMQLARPPRSWQTVAIVMWGPAGTGKTKYIQKLVPDAYWLPGPKDPQSSAWWDSYNGQDDVVIDEFYGWLPRTIFQRILDSTPLLVENKGGSVPFQAKRVWITSNQEPSQWWRNVGLTEAVARRIGLGSDPETTTGHCFNVKKPLWRHPRPDIDAAVNAILGLDEQVAEEQPDPTSQEPRAQTPAPVPTDVEHQEPEFFPNSLDLDTFLTTMQASPPEGLLERRNASRPAPLETTVPTEAASTSDPVTSIVDLACNSPWASAFAAGAKGGW